MTGRRPLIVMTAIAAPAALGLETLLRWWLFPADFELVREVARPVLTPIAWALGAIAIGVGVLGVAMQHRMGRRAVARLGEHAALPGQAERARLGAFLLAASVAQVPAILATLLFMFGASLFPVAVAVAIVTAAVLVQGARV